MKMETKLVKIMGHGKSSSKRELYGDTGLSQETRKQTGFWRGKGEGAG